MGVGPVPATHRLLKHPSISVGQLGVIKINEEFAAQGLAVLSKLGVDKDVQRVNPNGGASAFGDPLGMSWRG